jgi:hypothetical protein
MALVDHQAAYLPQQYINYNSAEVRALRVAVMEQTNC